MNGANCGKAASSVLITGISGYVGALIAAAILQSTDKTIIGIIRDIAKKEEVISNLRTEYEALGQTYDAHVSKRVFLTSFDEFIEIQSNMPKTMEIVHSAGSVDYFDEEQLESANIQYTHKVLELGKALGISRIIFISTAYSCGYIDGCAAEGLHPEPGEDPTVYTRTKRHAEQLVVKSGIPYLILRPSILVGDSKTGRYSGKRYGLYQQWMGLERLLCNRYHRTFHTVAPKQPLNLLHQDSFQAAFLAYYLQQNTNQIAHIVSRHDTTPTMRELWDMWLRAVSKPAKVYYYESVEDVPLKSIDIRQRSYLTFASINLQIGAHHWQFTDESLSKLRSEGLEFVDATLDSLKVCQDRFVSSSDQVQKFLNTFNSDFNDTQLQVIEVSPLEKGSEASELMGNISQREEKEASITT